MEIIWYGKDCVTVKGTNATIVIGPHTKVASPLKGDVVLLSHEAEEIYDISRVQGETQLFNWPGEYETKGVLITAIESKPKEGEEGEPITLFHLEIDGFKVVYLGDLGHRLTGDVLEALGDVDVLLIPVGNGLDAKKAHSLIEEIEPRVIIPIHYEDLSAFLKEMGSQPEPAESFKAKSRSELPEDTTNFVVLDAQP